MRRKFCITEVVFGLYYSEWLHSLFHIFNVHSSGLGFFFFNMPRIKVRIEKKKEKKKKEKLLIVYSIKSISQAQDFP